MAIVVPILLSYTGAAAAIGTAIGISATAVTAIASVAFQVTGVNDKINKAASKVFGEDLVKVVNIAGAVYGAVNGGFEFGSGAENASSINAVNGSDLASDMFSAANTAEVAAGGAGLASDGLGGIYGGSLAATDPSSAFAVNGMDSASDTFNLASKAAEGTSMSDGFNLIQPDSAMGTDTSAVSNFGSPQETASGINNTPATGITAPTAAATQASASNAAANQTNQALKAGDATRPVGSGPAAAARPPSTSAATSQPSFFDKLKATATSEKGMGMLIQGVGAGITNASKERLEKEKMAMLERHRTQTPTTRLIQ